MPQRLKFDRAEARRLRTAGWKTGAIAHHLGVTRQAIRYGLSRSSQHQDWLRSLSPQALADYRTYIRKRYPRNEARQAVTGARNT